MRIGMLAPIAWRTPPRHYGPWERVVSLLMEGLVQPARNRRRSRKCRTRPRPLPGRPSTFRQRSTWAPSLSPADDANTHYAPIVGNRRELADIPGLRQSAKHCHRHRVANLSLAYCRRDPTSRSAVSSPCPA